MFDNEYITLESVAALLNLPTAYLKRLVDAGKIPFIDMGSGRKRFQEQSVREALRSIEQDKLESPDFLGDIRRCESSLSAIRGLGFRVVAL